MEIHGKQLIAAELPENSNATFKAINPFTGESFGEPFQEATEDDVNKALQLAQEAYGVLRMTSLEQRALLLEAIADEIMALGDELLNRANEETGLPLGRLTGERGRTVNQARLFASMVREGSWVNARIDVGNPGRVPAPKPDVRTMGIGIGPVVVFGASNFPLAISVAGTDTIAALGAGCPVVAKAHPGHPGTCELLGHAIQNAISSADLPAGSFSMVQGAGHAVGLALVRHELTRAVAFTGGLKGGRALFDAAAARPDPIPVYAEMGSTNPIFLLPGALETQAKRVAEAYIKSVNLGVGQFCTNPGIVFGLEGDGLDQFIGAVKTLSSQVQPATMLHPVIFEGYKKGIQRIRRTEGVVLLNEREPEPSAAPNRASCMIFKADYPTVQRSPHLVEEELFGPASIVVACLSPEQMEEVAASLDGHLTATIHGTEGDLAAHANLLHILEEKVGRLIFNGFPTGIEVCAAMHHGGPYPATTNSHYTSIGTAAIGRFIRPVCYQNFPDALLPEALQNKNSLGIWRLVDNEMSQKDITQKDIT